MIKTFMTIALSLLLIITAVPFEAGGQESTSPGSNGYSGQGAPLTADELQQLLAPIALYPDALVAQILGAAMVLVILMALAIWICSLFRTRDAVLIETT